MLNSYKEKHTALRRDIDEGGDARASLVSKHMSSLLVILNKQLLRHQFLDASHTMEAITMAMDQVPDVVRKAGIEVLLHDDSAYGECLQLYKELFTKQRNNRVELLVEMTIFIATHGNIQEAYDTIQSQVSIEPFKSNPLVHGYCGMLQHMLWKREIQNTSVKRERIEGERGSGSRRVVQQDMKVSSKAQSYFKQALCHFETLRQLEIPETDNVNAFTILHYEMLMSAGRKEDGVELLMEQEKKKPQWICLKRYICGHLRQYHAHDVSQRLKYLKKLVELDDSCSEGLEYVELLLQQDPCRYEEPFRVVVRHLDYPSNAANDQAWDYLQQIQSSWDGYKESDLWISRLDWWTEMYPQRLSTLM